MSRRSHHQICAVAATVVFSASVLVACGNEPARGAHYDQERVVTISVNQDSTEQRVLGELYRSVLEEAGRDASVTQERDTRSSTRMDRLFAGDADFIVGCTGDLLQSLNPAQAAATTEEIGEADNPVDAAIISQGVYEEFVGALPGSFMTTDPSSAQGCTAGMESILPQNLVPVFRTNMLDRGEYQAVNNITVRLTTEDLDMMVQHTRQTDDPREAVQRWASAELYRSDDDVEQDSTDDDFYLYTPYE